MNLTKHPDEIGGKYDPLTFSASIKSFFPLFSPEFLRNCALFLSTLLFFCKTEIIVFTAFLAILFEPKLFFKIKRILH